MRSERERASDAGEAKQAATACRRAKRAAAKQQLGRRVGARARVASWAACVAGRCGKEQRAQASRPRGAVAGRPLGQASGRRRGKRAGLAGPEGVFLPFFFKSNVYQILFSPFSFLSQIQISFEYKFQIF